MLEGNIYINGKIVTPDANNNVILDYFGDNILECVGTLTITPEDGTPMIYTNQVWLNLRETLSKYMPLDSDDYRISTRVNDYVDKSSRYFDISLQSAGNQPLVFRLWMIMSSLYPDFCDQTYYGGEDGDIYIYYFASEGEDPEIIDVDDPATNTTEMYACDNYGPRLGTDSQPIANYDQTTSLDNEVGATFFSEENKWYAAKPVYDRVIGLYAIIVSGTYPHSNVTTDLKFRQPMVKWVTDNSNKAYEKYWGDPRVVYTIENWDFSSNIGGCVLYSGEMYKIIDSFEAKEPGLDYTVSPAPPYKKFAILDRPIMANFGLRPYTSTYGSWNPAFAYETWHTVSNVWDSYDYYGNLTARQAVNRVKAFLVQPEYTQYTVILPDYAKIPNEPKLWAIDYDASNFLTLTLGVNDESMGSVSGAGQYEYGTSADISATAYDGYMFVEWSDGDTNATRTITMESSITLTATFAEATPSPIPSTYQLVEWLKGTGNPRISTGIKDNNIGKIEAMWACSYSQTTGWAWSGTLQSSPAIRCGWGIRNSNNHLEAWWGSWGNTAADLGEYDKTDAALKQIVIDVVNKNASFNGGSPVALGNGTLATTGQNFYLFIDSSSSTLPSTQYFANVKIYNLQGNLVRDLYPVRRKSDNVGMMYDIVSNEVFANIFVGSFEVGPDKQWS